MKKKDALLLKDKPAIELFLYLSQQIQWKVSHYFLISLP